MGVIGQAIGTYGGAALGEYIGKKFKAGEAGKNIGRVIGSELGALTPYKMGGKVKRTGPALLHKNEFVLPASVKPTKAQKMKVAKLNKKRTFI